MGMNIKSKDINFDNPIFYLAIKKFFDIINKWLDMNLLRKECCLGNFLLALKIKELASIPQASSWRTN